MIESVIGHWPSILLYICVFAVSAALVYLGNNDTTRKRHLRTIFTTLGLLIPALLAGIRYYVGHDYENYAGMVERVQAGEPMWPRAIEPLSSLIINISASFGGSITMFFLFSAVTVYFAYFALKKLAPTGVLYITLGWFAYLCVQFPTTLNAVRSGASISVAAFAFSQLIDRHTEHRLIKFLALIGLASLFHISSLVYLPIGLAIYAISYGDKINIKLERVLFGLATICALTLPIFSSVIAAIPLELISNYARYFNEAGSSFYIPIVSLVMLAVLTLTYLINRTNTNNNPKLRNLYAVAAYYIPTSIAVGWLSYYTGTSRLTFFFDIVIIALLLYTLRESVGKKIIGTKATNVLIVSIVMFSSILLVRNLSWAGALPYKTVYSQETIYVRKD